jgi:predicted peptidase
MKVFRYILVIMLLVGCAAFLPKNRLDFFEYKVFENAKHESLNYRLLSPQHPEKGKKYPLVLFFHGAGERGTDNKSQLNIGPLLFAKNGNLEKYPCYMIVPQCPPDKKWVDTDWKLEKHLMPDTPATHMRLTMELLEQFISENPVDTNRIYVTGVSMGGFGTWDILMREPTRFAAAAPVCGGADDTKAALIKDIPVWVFHGGNDRLVKTIRSRNIVKALKTAGGHPVYTEYPGLGHNAWDSAYHDSRILEWMFKQSKK